MSEESKAQLTKSQRAAQVLADRAGAHFLTVIDGRVAIILRPTGGDVSTAVEIDRVATALSDAGLARYDEEPEANAKGGQG